jgi:putative secretion ATPase (PEP-CTERM system associated)
MYTDFYGFSERPFQLTPDPRFYFDSRTHKKAMSYLGYGLAQGEGFIVITGEVGTGKSTLSQHLMETIDRARLNAISLVSTQVDGDDMLRLAAQGMGIGTEGLAKAQLLERVEQWLEDEARNRKRTLLIVDEAQNLSVSALEELRMLSNFQIAGQALIQILLLGQPEFRDKLAHSEELEQLRQRVIATHHLGPIDEAELEAYVTHRLTIVGWQDRPTFTREAIATLYRHTGGIPRRINQLATRLMLFGAVEQLDSIGADTVEAVVADLAADGAERRAEGVLPLRGRSAKGKVADNATDAALERRIAMLETRVEEQDIALRRVLSLLVSWVEGGQADKSVRHNAA